MADDAAIVALIEKSGELPAMPSVVSEVLQKTDDPGIEMGEVSKIIENDPALTAKILQVSNSSYYGMKQYVDTLTLALVILGVREVRNIVLGVSVFETLKSDNTDAKRAQEIWNNSLAVAGMAKKITKTMSLGLQGQEFIAGLLADTGKMVLLRSGGDTYAKLLKENAESPRALLQRETETLGFNHAEAATALALKWDLPATLCDALKLQYSSEGGKALADATDPVLAAVIRISRAAVTDDFSEESGQFSINDDEAWCQLANAKSPITADQRFNVLKQFVDEIAEAPAIPL